MRISINNTINMRSALFAFIFTAALMVFVPGCDDDGDGNVNPGSADYLQTGWEKFEQGLYSEAYNDFQSAFAEDPNETDALNGTGWAAGRMGNLDEARQKFSTGWDQDTTLFDALGGLCFTLYQLGEWQESINRVVELNVQKPRWRFLHETTLDYRDLYLVASAAYYNLSDYHSSLEYINMLNPDFDVDVNTVSGRRELLEEIERLRQIYG